MQAAAKVLGVTTEVLDIHDGELEPTLENRKTITRLIRDWKADIVIATGPGIITRSPLRRRAGAGRGLHGHGAVLLPRYAAAQDNPVFLYSSDRFQKPYPFKPDIAVVDRRRDRPEARRDPRTGIATLRRRRARQ